ncbi:MAG: hypothetical protein GY953_05550, partial [bacterium]|nr:hypothetical protein [bacterium]
MFRIILTVFLLSYPVLAEESFLIRFGAGDSEAREWNGSVNVTGGRLVSVDPWQFDEADSLFGARWEASTKVDTYWHSPWERSLFGTKRQTKLSERGLILTVEMTGPGAVEINTTQGSFDFKPASIDW